MKKLLVVMVALLSITAFVNAAEEAAAQDLGVTVDLSYTSKYIWRGFDILDDVGAFQPSVNLDLGNGFSANVWMSYSGSGGTNGATASSPGTAGLSRVDLTEYNYTLAYTGTAYEDCPWKTNYQVGWRYYDFIDTASKDSDVQEIFLTGSMPALLDNGIVPRFGVFQMWEAEEGASKATTGRDFSGTIYAMGFGYDFTVDQAPELPMTFSWDIVYNDGTGHQTVDHDWSHMVWGLSTSMTCPATGGTLTPAIYFQNSFEDSVNTQDEFWASISYSFSF
ncbi:MAG: hypothetical protein H8E62_08965 [Planctomycetes bacterium]|nr:hypothetical protein [Planctomycetota bacterium]